jgi:mannose-6-phosphate isomerase
LRRTKSAEPSKTALIGPLTFTHEPVQRVWGGRALEEMLGHNLPTDQPYGETWDISDLADHSSRVAEGPHRGRTLTELWRDHYSELVSRPSKVKAGFPLLIKWLDCRDWLSVQVHPDDAMAREVLDQPYGKSEVWIVLHAEPAARVYAGLQHGVSREEFLQHVETGTVDQCLHSFKPQVGDCIVLPAGTIHAAGGGLLMAEVQQSSDATFRIFDWNRLGFDGKPRPLQVEMGLDAIDWKQGAVQPTIPISIPVDVMGVQGETVADLPAFTIERYRLQAPWKASRPGEFAVWMVLDGSVRLSVANSAEEQELSRGQTVMVPAAAGEALWSPLAQDCPTILLRVRLPNYLV